MHRKDLIGEVLVKQRDALKSELDAFKKKEKMLTKWEKEGVPLLTFIESIERRGLSMTKNREGLNRLYSAMHQF